MYNKNYILCTIKIIDLIFYINFMTTIFVNVQIYFFEEIMEWEILHKLTTNQGYCLIRISHFCSHVYD